MNGILSDKQIAYLVTHRGMIENFVGCSVRTKGISPVISYGLSSYGYDLRLSGKDFKVYRLQEESTVIDPKRFHAGNLSDAFPVTDGNQTWFTIPAHGYALGVSVEKFKIPEFVTGIAVGKSTYARSGVLLNITPLEAGWNGYLTLEIANLTPLPVKVYCNEGIAQILFLKGDPCDITYNHRNGKYQHQPDKVVLPRM